MNIVWMQNAKYQRDLKNKSIFLLDNVVATNNHYNSSSNNAAYLCMNPNHHIKTMNDSKLVINLEPIDWSMSNVYYSQNLISERKTN